MAHTHLCLLYHVVYGTKNREPWLTSEIKHRLFPYTASTLKNLNGKAVIINGTKDHIHILCHLRSTPSIAEVVQAVKSNSSGWIHKTFGLAAFAWQEGYGAFTVSASQKDKVYRYISQQEEHHKSKTFQEEYLEFLRRHGVEYDERFVWG